MYFATFLLFVLLGSKKAGGTTEKAVDTRNLEWDFLIFTQHWPITVCYQWKEKGHTNQCSFPTLRDIWTIHGIWPTRTGTEGPFYCNNTWHFDPSQINGFEQQLNLYWINIEKNTPLVALWEHEWTKHGTCAASLAELDNEAKYFKQGLDWIGKYDMQFILSKSGILPNRTQGYSIEEIYNSVTNVLTKRPAIECINAGGVSYLFEIRICFDKKLELIDCDGIKNPKTHVDSPIITSCPLNTPVLYPSVVPVPPAVDIVEFDIPWQLNLYRFLQFLIWFTL